MCRLSDRETLAGWNIAIIRSQLRTDCKTAFPLPTGQSCLELICWLQTKAIFPMVQLEPAEDRGTQAIWQAPDWPLSQGVWGLNQALP